MCAVNLPPPLPNPSYLPDTHSNGVQICRRVSRIKRLSSPACKLGMDGGVGERAAARGLVFFELRPSGRREGRELACKSRLEGRQEG